VSRSVMENDIFPDVRQLIPWLRSGISLS
jgi:hypothetical protein